MKLTNITLDNVNEYARQSYTNIYCHSVDEYEEDLLHIKYLKRIFRYYEKTNTLDALRIRRALNHLVVLFNVFRADAITRILFLRLTPELHIILKTFLLHLSYMPAIVHGINGVDIYSNTIPSDEKILLVLKNL